MSVLIGPPAGDRPESEPRRGRMGVDHRRGNILVAEELLDGADVAAVLEHHGL